MKWLSLLSPLVLAGCLDMMGTDAWVAELRKAGIPSGMLSITSSEGGEFITHQEASSFVSRHRGQEGVFVGNLMQARKTGSRGELDVMHWRPHQLGRSCVPNRPTGQCLNPRGGLPRTIVRCKGQSWASLMSSTGGQIANSTGYPWKRGGNWDHVTIVGRVARVTRGKTSVGNEKVPSGRPDFGYTGRHRGMSFAFSVIELTNCRLATFQSRAVSS